MNWLPVRLLATMRAEKILNHRFYTFDHTPENSPLFKTIYRGFEVSVWLPIELLFELGPIKTNCKTYWNICIQHGQLLYEDYTPKFKIILRECTDDFEKFRPEPSLKYIKAKQIPNNTPRVIKNAMVWLNMILNLKQRTVYAWRRYCK